MSVREYSAGGLVSREGRLLLVKVRNLSGKVIWTFPKGHLEKGETSRQAALREVEEETGWRCRIERPLFTARYHFRRKGALISKSVRWYGMEPVEKVGKPDAKEILAVRWAGPEAGRGLLSYSSDLELLDIFVDGARTVPGTLRVSGTERKNG